MKIVSSVSKLLWCNLPLSYSFASKPFLNYSTIHQHRYYSSSASLEMSKLQSPSAERNKDPIWEVLQAKILPRFEDDSLSILEVASGAGVHMQHFSSRLLESGRSFHWYSTDPSDSALASQQAYLDENPILRKVVERPMHLTVTENGIHELEARQNIPEVDLIVNINMIHISPWETTVGLMKAAQSKLKPGGILYLYGPFKEHGACVESNLRFDEWLKEKDPAYGVRDLERVLDLAQTHQLEFIEKVDMPANNLSILLEKV